jgi:hypothetical protein
MQVIEWVFGSRMTPQERLRKVRIYMKALAKRTQRGGH